MHSLSAVQHFASWRQVRSKLAKQIQTHPNNFLANVSLGQCSCFVLNFLPGSFDAAVIQTPRHLIKMKGQQAEMNCNPEKDHTAVFWYQQKQSKELKFLIYFQNQRPVDQIDMVKERFSTEWPSNSRCSLKISTSEVEDSALYLCSSSQSTALKCTLPSVHKLTGESLREQVMLEVKEINWPQCKPQQTSHRRTAHPDQVRKSCSSFCSFLLFLFCCVFLTLYAMVLLSRGPHGKNQMVTSIIKLLGISLHTDKFGSF